MYNTYNYSLTKKINKIIFIQTFWRKYKLSTILKNKNNISSKDIEICNIILKNILKLDLKYDIITIILKKIDNEFCICDPNIIHILKIYQSYLLYSIIYKTYNINQLKKNIEKILLLVTINDLKSDIDKLEIKISSLSNLTQQYIHISNLQLHNKVELLKKILSEHIKLVENILIDYHNLGHQLSFDYIKQLNNQSYFSIYNKFIQSHNIKNKYFNYKDFYNHLDSFISYKNIYDLLFIKDYPITLKKTISFHDKLNIVCIFLDYF